MIFRKHEHERELMIVAFTLSMPGNNSWNSKWSGDGRCYCILKSFTSQKAIAKVAPLLGESFAHCFGDGWIAAVSVRQVDASESRRLRKASKGFCGYDWMVESILRHGRIMNTSEEREHYKRLKESELATA